MLGIVSAGDSECWEIISAVTLSGTAHTGSWHWASQQNQLYFLTEGESLLSTARFSHV